MGGEHTTYATRHRRTRSGLAALALTGLGFAGIGATAQAASDEPTMMMPTGGGYESVTLEAFAKAAISKATDKTVDIVVVPSSYGDDWPSRPENIALAKQRTAEVAAACTAVAPPGKSCTGRLAILLNRADAMKPANSAALRDASLDGIFILGGDQGIAMKVLANSPAEKAMTDAVHRGAVLGGTSAGAAVESVSMINGYVGDYGAAQGLRRGSTLMWWRNDGDAERGLVFGSQRAIYDQHFYERGRFGRSLSTIATADERFGGKSPVGVGVDYATSITNYGDRTLTQVVGNSGAATIDFESLGATHRWVGTERWLSARKVKVNLLTEGNDYDLVTRRLTLNGKTVGDVSGRAWSTPRSSADGILYVGGGVLGGGKVIPSVVKDAAAASANPQNGRVLILSADTRGTAAAYGDKLKVAGWPGHIDQATFGKGSWASVNPGRYDAVLIVAVSPPQAAKAFGNATFRALAAKAFAAVPVVFADGPAAAYAGTRWSGEARPNGDNYEEKAGAAFKTSEAKWHAGAGVVGASIIPALNTDYVWGRLFNAVAVDKGELGLGISAGTAIRFHAGSATVVDGSVVVADGRDARTWVSSNGTLGAAGLVVDTFGPGEALRR
ncbi:Type 1 glutamine amidotransferase-like domain-containing protein [Nostocoides veronense]|uniref:Type 1 glutamine amidotransferase-like domain-containing protein n=1 Tax=Nostocoides veronense TaxID=330836 RepID=A0ABP4XL16_9MICO